MFALDGLVGVGVGTQVDRRAAVAGLRELLFEQGHGIGLGDQPGLEIQPRRHVPVRMAGPRIAIDATVFYYKNQSPGQPP
ncbi:hypothetical protein D3C72_2103030 [compost metagenome]